MNLKMILMIALLATSTSNAFAIYEDVAIDPKTGDTLIIQKANNPLGKIIFLNDLDKNFKQELNLLPIESNSATFEIELIKSGAAVALAKIDNQYVMKKIVKENGEWKVLKYPSSYGTTPVGNLTALKNGDISFNAIYEDEEKIVILDIESFERKDVISANLVRLKALEIAPELEISSDATPEEISLVEGDDDDDDDEIDLRRSGMGFAAGAITGLGISYRRHLANKWGYQFTGIPWASSSSYFVSVGANFMRTLHATERTRFMAIGGVSSYLRGFPAFGFGWGDGIRARINIINIGVGIGMEFALGSNLGLSIELPVVLMIGDEFGIYPIPSVSLIYYFL